MLVPAAFALLRIVEPLAAVMHQHVQHDVFRHPHGEIGIDDPHDRHIGQLGIRDEVIDAGAERKNRLQMGKTGQQPARRLPGTGIGDVGGIAQTRRQPDIAPAARASESVLPARRIETGEGQEDCAHPIARRRPRAPSPD